MRDLRALAEAATPGPWARPRLHGASVAKGPKGGGYVIAECRGDRKQADAAYIAAASPDRILAMLDVVEAARPAMAAMQREHDGCEDWTRCFDAGHAGVMSTLRDALARLGA